jgi:hypothetical protein
MSQLAKSLTVRWIHSFDAERLSGRTVMCANGYGLVMVNLLFTMLQHERN